MFGLISSIIAGALGIYSIFLVVRKNNTFNNLKAIPKFVVKFFILLWAILCLFFATLMIYCATSSVKDVKQGTIILELSNCSTYMRRSEDPYVITYGHGVSRIRTRTNTDYLLKGIDLS